MALKVKDSGTRQEYESGARRDNPEDKGMMDLVPPEALLRLSRWYEWGGLKYGYRNWERGMPISRYISAAIRHSLKYLAGCNDEDHLSAAVWNLLAIMHHEQLRPEMQDIPVWKDRKSKWLYILDYGDDE